MTANPTEAAVEPKTDGPASPSPTPHPAKKTKKRSSDRLSTILRSTEFQLLVGLITLSVVFLALFPDTFGTTQNVRNMATVAGILLVVAIGQSLVLLVGGFDLSVAANMGFVSIVAALQMSSGAPVTQAILVSLGAAAAVGLINGILIAVLKITPFVATLGMLTFLGGYANQLSGGRSIAGLPPEFSYFGGGSWGPIPSAVGIAAIVVAISWALLSRTRLGLYIYSIGGSPETSRVAGIAVARVRIAAFTLCGLLAGLAGLMVAARVSVGQDTLGSGYDLLSIATSVIGGVAIGGGIGRLSGVILGVVTLTVLTTGLDIAGLNDFVKQMVTGVVLIAAVLFAQIRGYRISSIFGLHAGILHRAGKSSTSQN